ncbi:carbohydrate-binding family 9-like protein [Pedobacter xixiisoli]|uniref:Carbohydrate-binding family 9 n=1 Tax=Pedobacter xixiisoli TaxID=1476464 RepID=A0A285ZUH6_9SPHI|nr:carbohydrate-binding family 9-like protein [Pedobacter xixiisoli]SOD13300.1 Carbohydrate-binding family 9 [Pedobacter xixiisoli]
MRRLEIPFLETDDVQEMDKLNQLMVGLKAIAIDCNPWPAYQADAKANFLMAHNGDAILLKYIVAERYIAANEVTNGNIHNDSCVELFIAFDNDGYYNLEFNCLGFTKIGYGYDRSDRKLLPVDVIKQLSFSSKINANSVINSNGGFDWEIMLVIPRAIFIEHEITSFNNLKAKGNFYKCGDGLPQPHFLTWNMIEAEQPDFHRKDFFGELTFA